MFTLEQIKTAHNKVKSGADFAVYIQDLKKLGVFSYETFVSDGHTDYFGKNNYKISTPVKYEELLVKESSDSTTFIANLKAHQQGKTDYLTFCSDCAKFGIEKWIVCMEKMTCTYYDKAGNEVLKEKIPQ